MADLVLTAPLSGWLLPLDEVPDPAFAQGMVGAGAAIDPTDALLRAPCDGRITLVAEARHALTLTTDNGAEILLHVGIDTMALGGEGFAPRVAAGQRVRRGDPLLDIDLDGLVYRARSLVTPVVLTNSRSFDVRVPRTNRLLEAGEPFIELTMTKEAGEEAGRGAGAEAAASVTVPLEHGFHARPAARLVRAARRYVSRVTLSAHGRHAEAGSTVALMSLGIRRGDSVELRACGPDAADAVRGLAAEIASGLGEAPPRKAPPPRPDRAPEPAGANDIRGIVASRGIAVGVAQHYEMPALDVCEEGGTADVERAALTRARQAAKERLGELARHEGDTDKGGGGDILEAQLEFFDDPGLLEDAEASIREGKSAGFAWRQAIRRAQSILLSLNDPRLAERVADLRDVEAQVLHALAGREAGCEVQLMDDAVVLAQELLPSQLSRLDLAKVAGFCTAGGGPTSHVALLAASKGIPALVGAGPKVLAVDDGVRVILDAEEGLLKVAPDASDVEQAAAAVASRQRLRARHLQDAAQECVTADGCRIEVLANLASLDEARDALAAGAEGCGLLRTEFLFQDRADAPAEDEQATVYRAFAGALEGRPLVIRTLDAGGDKPIPYLPVPVEANPLLGLRGLRLTLRYPDLLREQLAAILRLGPASGARVLLPMITEPQELLAVRAMLEELARERSLAPVPLGAMIETPASVVLAAAIAREADFLSIGSNDLAQYTLATDRAHPDLSGAFELMHPAVLRQIGSVCSAAGPQGCRVSVCGALASDPAAVPVLLGLGVRTLSVVPGLIPEIKALVRQLSLSACSELARRALETNSAQALRALIKGNGAAPRRAQR